MMRSLLLRRGALCAALLLAAAEQAAAVGTEFTYQGELREAGAPLNGTADFEFRLYDAASGGTQLGTTRTLDAQAIANGVFTATLDFGDQFTGAPRWIEIAVRRSGQATFITLAPRQPLTATPYAQHADFVADNSIVGANIADGSIGAADLASSSVSTTQISNGGVQTIDLADASVTTPKLADAAVTASKLGGAAVGTVALADASVTAAKLAPGAIGATQINSAQVQVRVGTKCPSGLPLIGLGVTGAPICDDSVFYLGNNLTRPRLGLAGSGDTVRIAAIDQILDNLVFVSCGDSACSDGPYPVVLDTNIGASTSVALVLRSQLPLVAYHDAAATDLHAFDCDNSNCTSSVFRSLDTSGDAGFGVDAALRNGNLPVIAYLDADASPELRLYDCDDSDCSTGTVRTLDSTNVDPTVPVSVTIDANGRPVVFYRGSGAANGLNAYVCSNTDCTSGNSYDLNDEPARGLDSVNRGSGFPMVSYVGTNDEIKLFDCSGLVCSFGTSRAIGPATSTNATAIALQTGSSNPIIAHYSFSALRVYVCDNQSCSTGSENIVVADFDYNGYTSLALRTDGRPVLLGEWENEDGSVRLRLDTCGNLECAQ
jgi:hypothetical protein